MTYLEPFYPSIMFGIILNLFVMILFILVHIVRISIILDSPSKMMKLQHLGEQLKNGVPKINTWYVMFLPYAKVLEIGKVIKEEYDYKIKFGGDLLDFLAYKLKKDLK